jgi:hypothetical protein
MRAAEDVLASLHTVADDAHLAVGAGRSQIMDGAFEAIVGGALSTVYDLEGVFVIVAADFAGSHGASPEARNAPCLKRMLVGPRNRICRRVAFSPVRGDAARVTL